MITISIGQKRERFRKKKDFLAEICKRKGQQLLKDKE